MKILKELLPYIIILLLVILVRTFIVSPAKVNGGSMLPTLYNGDVLLVKKYDTSYERFDIVVVKYGKERIIKRIIGLPGETIFYKNNNLFINGKKIDLKNYKFKTRDFDLAEIGYSKIPKDCYFVLGDNRYNSKDSRYIGTINKKDIIGIADYRVWPFSTFGHVN